MGLGKTVQALALIVSDLSGNPICYEPPNPKFSEANLIVCPLSVIANWENQLKVFLVANNAVTCNSDYMDSIPRTR